MSDLRPDMSMHYACACKYVSTLVSGTEEIQATIRQNLTQECTVYNQSEAATTCTSVIPHA